MKSMNKVFKTKKCTISDKVFNIKYCLNYFKIITLNITNLSYINILE